MSSILCLRCKPSQEEKGALKRLDNCYVQGYVKLTVSQFIDSDRKSTALEEAHSRCSRQNIEIPKLLIQDDRLAEHRVYVDQVAGVKWFYAEPTEISNRYRIVGKIALKVYMEVHESAEVIRKSSYMLVPRVYMDSPVLVVTAGSENVFLQVTEFDVHWDTDQLKDDGFAAAV
jgi:hypothetical protein